MYLSIGYSLSTPTEETGFAHSLKLSNSTVDSNLINEQLLYLFYTYWDGVSPVRRISVAATRLADRYGEQLDLFNPPKYDMVKLEDTVDAIRKRFGKMTPSANALARRQSCGRPAWRRVARLSKEASW